MVLDWRLLWTNWTPSSRSSISSSWIPEARLDWCMCPEWEMVYLGLQGSGRRHRMYEWTCLLPTRSRQLSEKGWMGYTWESPWDILGDWTILHTSMVKWRYCCGLGRLLDVLGGWWRECLRLGWHPSEAVPCWWLLRFFPIRLGVGMGKKRR